VKREEHVRELLDGPVPAAERAVSLADVAWLNAWFAGNRLTLRAVWQASGSRAGEPLRVLDVGGGSGDLARRLVRWGRGRGRSVRVVVVDTELDALRLARSTGPAGGELLLVRADAAALPFRRGSMDVAVAALVLHHLDPDAAVRALREMAAVARRGVVVSDLLRSRLSLVLVWLATRIFRCHPISRYDGPLSVRRAYAPEELHALARKAGLGRLEVRRHPLWGRLLAVVRA
jgi:ubiquinone/menaquinone biosynthesis C-methylase UbiE